MNHSFKVGDLVTRAPGDYLDSASFRSKQDGTCIYLSSLPLTTVYIVRYIMEDRLTLEPTEPGLIFSSSSGVNLGSNATRLRPYRKYLLRRRND